MAICWSQLTILCIFSSIFHMFKPSCSLLPSCYTVLFKPPCSLLSSRYTVLFKPSCSLLSSCSIWSVDWQSWNLWQSICVNNTNGDLLCSACQFYGNNKAVIRVTSQYWHQQLEWSCSTAWPSWYMKEVFL